MFEAGISRDRIASSDVRCITAGTVPAREVLRAEIETVENMRGMQNCGQEQ
jgi:hypothetical protein